MSWMTMHVLIAHAEPDTRLPLAAEVERLGHRCTQASDGQDALALVREHAPEVVIAGWELPGMDATELARLTRSEHDADYSYVVVLAGGVDEAAARAAIVAGADDLVAEPLEPAALERKLIAAERLTALQRRAHREGSRDPLTGIGNRARLAEDLHALCGRVARYGHGYCVALLDVDDFRTFNEGAGYAAGDDALRAVADALAATVRSGDTLYRYGGEQFLVLLPEQTLDGAVLAGERLRAAVEALALERPDGGTVTVSVGVAGLGSTSCGPEQLFELADQALSVAKDGGRNRVEVATAVADDDRAGRPIRLLVADRDASVRLTLATLARGEEGLDLVGAAADAQQAVELAGLRRPDVVLLDFDMPDGAGVRAALDIREAMPGVRIVALSADESPAAQLDMSRAGAVGYVVKGAGDDETVRVLRSAARW